jgi:hypothetical protein
VQQLLLWQVWLPVQLSVHVMVPPHPLETVPQATPWQAVLWVSGVQQVSLLQVWPAAQVFVQETVPPHPSGAVPQATP